MIDTAQLDSILKSALRAVIAKRCKRAYIHEFRNSLQTVYVGIDLVARLLDGKGTVAKDRVLQMARRAVQGHEQTLTGALEHLAGQEEELCAVDTATVLQELVTFLNNDAAARSVAISVTASGTPQLMARPENIRLVLLSVLTYGIDTLSNGGEIGIDIATDVGGVIITFVSSPAAEVSDGVRWDFGDARAASSDNWALYATRRLVLDDGGEIESRLDAQNARSVAVRLRYQAAKPSSLEDLDKETSPRPPSD